MTSRTEARPRAASRNPITGDKLQTKPATKAYRDGWDAIFGKYEELKISEKIRDKLEQVAFDTLTKEDKDDREIQESK